MAVSIQTQIGEANCEIRMRREVYPRQVGARKIRIDHGDSPLQPWRPRL